MWTPVLVAVCTLAAGGSGLSYMGARSPWEGASVRIHGGATVDISQFPWQVSVMWDGYHLCGGSIVSPYWVLTAAHCIDIGGARWYAVRAGTSKLNEGGTVHKVRTLIFHYKYNSTTADYDIGVVKIRGKFKFGDAVQAVKLGKQEPNVGTSVTVTGWGATETDPSSDRLRAVVIEIVDRGSCSTIYNEHITQRMICAGVAGGNKSSCHGDSGGPLVVDNTQYGVVSGRWNEYCGEPGYPAFYTNVAALYVWIEDKTGI